MMPKQMPAETSTDLESSAIEMLGMSGKVLRMLNQLVESE